MRYPEAKKRGAGAAAGREDPGERGEDKLPWTLWKGGQWVFVDPALDLVAIFTGGNDNRVSDRPLDIVRRYVFPAIL
jgi:hypothetical protein